MRRKTQYERGFEAGWSLGVQFFHAPDRPRGCTCFGRGRPCFVCSTAGETEPAEREDDRG